MDTKLPPFITENTEGEADLRAPSVAEERWTVFLVEDDYDDTQLAVRVLKNSPRVHKIVCVSDAIGLFKELDNQQFYKDDGVKQRGLILLDIHMPGMDGLSLLEQLRGNPFTQHLPVVMITGDSEQRKLHQSYMLNANAYISKPFTEEDLDSIHAVFDKGSGWGDSSH